MNIISTAGIRNTLRGDLSMQIGNFIMKVITVFLWQIDTVAEVSSSVKSCP